MLYFAAIQKAIADTKNISKQEALEETKRMFAKRGHDSFQSQQTALTDILEKVEKMWGVDFNPTSSVVSAVMSQEVIKVITLRDHPAHGMLVYDSQNQTFSIEK